MPIFDGLFGSALGGMCDGVYDRQAGREPHRTRRAFLCSSLLRILQRNREPVQTAIAGRPWMDVQ